MPNSFECEHNIEELQVRDIEGGIVNVGQSWQSGVVHPPLDAEAAGTTRSAAESVPDGSEHLDPPPMPKDLNELVYQVQWLWKRVSELEQAVKAHGGMVLPRKMEFKIQKLYVKELTGTLNIGVTSIQDGPVQWSAPSPSLEDEDAADWEQLEHEGDEDWSTDIRS